MTLIRVVENSPTSVCKLEQIRLQENEAYSQACSIL